MEYKFGICYCDLDISNKIEDLEVFDTYEEAHEHYMNIINNYFENNPRWIVPSLWIVWIRKSNNRIEQFEQLSWNTKCRLIDIKEENYE